MSRPSIWFYPTAGGAAEELNLGWSIQELARVESYLRATPTNGVGAPTSYGLLGRTRVRVRKERVTSQALIAGLRAVESHLLRGGVIGIAADRSKMFAAYVTTGLYAGGSTIEGGGNIYQSIMSEAQAIAAGDVICLESGNPNYRREELTISTVSTASATHSITTTTPIRFDRDASAGVMVRHRDCYPALYLPEDQLGRALVTSEHGALWTFEAELEVVESLFSADVNIILSPGEVAEMADRSNVADLGAILPTSNAYRPDPSAGWAGASGRPDIVMPPSGGWVVRR